MADVREGQRLGLQRELGLMSNELGWAGERRGWAALTQQGALAQAGMALDKAKLNAMVSQDQNALPVIEALDTEIRDLVDKQGSMQPGMVSTRINSVNAKIRMLNQMGAFGRDPRTGQPLQMPLMSAEDVIAKTAPFGITRIK
jgi:hypothetical protein